MLKNLFVPVAIDQWATRRQQDNEGDFWRKLAGQGPRNDFSRTTQGLYIAGADGRLIAFNNNRGPERIRKLLQDALNDYHHPPHVSLLEKGEIDRRFTIEKPEGASVVRVGARVDSGYSTPSNQWDRIFASAISRDNLWITSEEKLALQAGNFPDSLAWRIARFHLTDNTRGEPPVWQLGDVRSIEFELEKSTPDRDGSLSGSAALQTPGARTVLASISLETTNEDRGYVAQIKGSLEFDEAGELSRFDLLATGDFYGEGAYTKNAPTGKFPLTVAFTLADGSDIADELPPHAARGWPDGYLNATR